MQGRFLVRQICYGFMSTITQPAQSAEETLFPMVYLTWLFEDMKCSKENFENN